MTRDFKIETDSSILGDENVGRCDLSGKMSAWEITETLQRVDSRIYQNLNDFVLPKVQS